MQAKRLIFKNSTGDRAYICENSIVVEFGVCRNGISTSDLNGGYKKDFKTAFNHYLSQKNDEHGGGVTVEHGHTD